MADGHDVGLVSLSVAHVMYDPDSPLGEAMAHVTFVPQVIIVAMAALVLFRRDLETAYFLAGLVANTALCVVLKRAVRQPRPAGSFSHGYGMPSNHSQFMGFFAVFAHLLLARRVRFASRLAPAALRLLAALLAGVVACSRWYLNVHSVEQIAVGLAVGSAAAVAWFAVGDALVRPRYAAVASSAVGRFFLVRDLTHVDNVMLREYESALAASAAAARRERKEGGAKQR